MPVSSTAPPAPFPDPSLDEAIVVRGARVHNLQNIDVDIPRSALVVITGVSGSGKSSLAFDTVFAEGQRRYLESVSTYVRQFHAQRERPDVDLIDGLPPAISLSQFSGSVPPRSTLATTTEIYDFLRILYARVGLAHCTSCGEPVVSQTADQIVSHVMQWPERTRLMLLAPLVRSRRGAHRDLLEKVARNGFVRARIDGELVDIQPLPELAQNRQHTIEAVIDRLIVKEGIAPRLKESIQLAVRHGEGECTVSRETDGLWSDHLFSTRFACPACQISFSALEPRSFSFNSPYGACRECDGLGTMAEQDECPEPICRACDGTRLSDFPRAVTVLGLSLPALTRLSVADAFQTLQEFERRFADESTDGEAQLVVRQILPEIRTRLQFLLEVGLDYLTLDRPTATLSGGELQRARLAGCLGTGLEGACYVLDEPTSGLHPRDTQRLIRSLCRLRDQGSSVLVVEHDLDVMRLADWIIDLGPGAGREGGQIVATGPPEQIAASTESLTARAWRQSVEIPVESSHPVTDQTDWLRLTGLTQHNLKAIELSIPLARLTCVTGVSGSGKSSAILQSLVPAVRARLADPLAPLPSGTELSGIETIERLLQIDQQPIGRSGKSNPATFSKIWDHVRKIFAATREARLRGFGAGRFSFNSKSGRCPECKGNGNVRIEMNFLPDLYVPCPDCKGARFNPLTLSVHYRDRSVADVLAMRFDEAAEFFADFRRLNTLLNTFVEVGLGYLTLGQSALTLSGGEAQRIKLATELGKVSGAATLFVLDEPTSGLHPTDIDRLVGILDRLVELGHTVVVVEHNLQVIRSADWLIDLGPEGGAAGGEILATGSPHTLARHQHSFTAAALRGEVCE